MTLSWAAAGAGAADNAAAGGAGGQRDREPGGAGGPRWRDCLETQISGTTEKVTKLRIFSCAAIL